MTTQHILWDFYTGVCKFYVFFMTGLWIICWWLTAREKLFFNIWTQRRYIEKFYPQPSYGGKYVITRLQGKPNLSETLFMKKFKLWNLETLKIIYTYPCLTMPCHIIVYIFTPGSIIFFQELYLDCTVKEYIKELLQNNV